MIDRSTRLGRDLAHDAFAGPDHSTRSTVDASSNAGTSNASWYTSWLNSVLCRSSSQNSEIPCAVLPITRCW
ncbi:hypothetical protein [Amycolatopsis echigonensis]|uniref:hypothetical protein n=1 Tax=Amycolatopsis echigonensis TaxID=2576905 RepID=UPI003A523AE1